MKLQAPIEVELKVSITNGSINGVATIGLGHGAFPTEERMRKAIADFEAGNSMPDGFRLMTKREWWDTICPPSHEEDEDGEVYTSRFAIPGDEHEWDA